MQQGRIVYGCFWPGLGQTEIPAASRKCTMLCESHKVAILLRALTLMFALGALQAAVAQLSHVVQVLVKPELQSEWEDLQKEYNAAVQEKNLIARRHIWQEARGNVTRYHLIRPFSKYAEFDDASVGAKAMGEVGFAGWVARVTKTIQSREVVVSEFVPELSILPEPDWKPNLAVFLIRETTGGKRGEYEAVVRDEILPVQKKAGVDAFFVGRGRWGWPTRTWFMVGFPRNWAHLDEASPGVWALGSARGAQLILRTEMYILRYRAELSFGGFSALSG